LHIENGIEPPTALTESQRWLRSSTVEDFSSYIERLRRRSTIGEQQSSTMLKSIKNRGLSDETRFGAIWSSIQEKLASRKGGAKMSTQPFVHPYFWGGFVYTRL